MDANQEKILDRVRNLLRLAQGGANEHESAAAAAAAQRLLEAHRLDQAMLNVAEERQAEEVGVSPDPLDKSKILVRWKNVLANGVARANGCRSYYDRRKGLLQIVGAPSDVSAVRYLYLYLTREIDQLAARYAGKGRAWIHAWRVGCVETVIERLKSAREEGRLEAGAAAQSGGVSLARVNQGLAGLARIEAQEASVLRWATANLVTKNVRRAYVDPSGYSTGKVDGKNVNVASGPRLQ